MSITIRKMQATDITDFPKAFDLQGWTKPRAQFQKYFEEQEQQQRQVFVAAIDHQVAGYATLLPSDPEGPFKDQHIPTICDFNVLEKYQHQGVGTAILDCIETAVKDYSSVICLGVGLHAGYGSAQRLYVKRGYIPDGSGVWYNNQNLEQNAPCANDDELVLYLSKKL